MDPRVGPEPSPLPRTKKQQFLEAIPFGLGVPNKPRHYLEMLKTLWDNKGRWLYAWRILKHGVCDGCSLGPYGLKDDVIEGIHLCTTRLRLLRLNTMSEYDPALLADVESLKNRSNEDLHQMGRLPAPMIRPQGKSGFSRIGWDEVVDLLADRLGDIDPMRTAWFATSRGITNEGYYAFQKAARVLGSPHVDYCARLCHAPSSIGLADVFGVGAPNCSLRDMVGTDLLVLWGTNLASNQPVATKYMAIAKEQGTRIVVVNPYREPALEKYWVPSLPMSAVGGTRLMDDFYQVRIGGDIAFMNGIFKALHETNGFAVDFLQSHAVGLDDLERMSRRWDWEELENASGISEAEMRKFAAVYKEARTAVFVYSMGLTQQTFGVENVRSLATLAAVRGMVGRKYCGVMPIRGHSGVQGGAEVGLAPDKFPGGLPVTPENAAKMKEAWGVDVPGVKGMAAPEMIEAAGRGEIDFLYSLGGNLLETMPDRAFVKKALERVPIRVHQDICMNSSMLLDSGEMVILLPTQTRYEMAGGCTSTSTERRIRFSPEIPGPRVKEAKPEWLIPAMIVRRVDLAYQNALPWENPAEIREEIERLVPIYEGIARLKEEGDAVQWGGVRLFERGVFDKMPGGKLRLLPQEAPKVVIPPGKFHLTTRRGMQFNSLVQAARDPATGRSRDAVFMSAEDAKALDLADGDAVELVSGTGRLAGRVALAPVHPRTLQVFWPESNVLMSRRCDPVSKEPAYNVMVQVKKP